MRATSRSLLALVAALALLGAACSSDGEAAAGRGRGHHRRCTLDFTAAQLTGGELAGASLVGSPTVLWFWAPWCTVCRAEAPDVNAAVATVGDEVRVVGVAGRGEVPEMEAFVSDTETGGIEHVVDDDGSIWRSFGVTSQPAFAFIDADGTVVDVQVGALGEDDLVQRMRSLSAA